MAWSPKPCVKCGGPKPTGRGVHYCEECSELVKWQADLRRRRKRAPCIKCKRPKEPGHGRRLCEACRAKSEPRCRLCGENPPRAEGKALCEVCFEISLDRRRWQRRKHNKKRRENAELRRAENRASWQRRKADPVRHARSLEQRRLRYRLKAEAEGRVLRRSPVSPVSLAPDVVPGRPLAAAIDRLAGDSGLVGVCELADVAQRQVHRWRSGESDVPIDEADRVLTALDLQWWEVWSAESVRVPLFVVHAYTWKAKKARGKLIVTRIHVRAVPYGDAGPDAQRVAEISSLMTGEAVAA